MFKNLLNRIGKFVKDQGGMEALQTVCITAIAATVMVGGAKVAQEGSNWLQDNWEKIQKQEDDLDRQLENFNPSAGGNE